MNSLDYEAPIAKRKWNTVLLYLIRKYYWNSISEELRKLVRK